LSILTFDLNRRLLSEFIGTAFLLATVVGSGIMAETLSGGNIGLALLANTIATGAILFVLITMFGPISGAHFNPAVTLVFCLRGEISKHHALLYLLVQIMAGIVGVFAAHVMFDENIIQFSQKIRTGPSQWFAEWVATFGLLATILATLKTRSESVPMAVGLYITAAYWFTASTSFANPAVTIARAWSDTFAGIRPEDVGGFILAQLFAAICAFVIFKWLFQAHENNPVEHS